MFKKIITIAALAFLITSCKPVAKDGYAFGEKQYSKKTVQVNIVEYPTRQSFNKELARRKLTKDVVAFSTIAAPFDKCTIHMVDPSVEYVPEFIGHEFAHCAYGQWHTNNNSKS
jgi:hypothetical protein